MDRANAHDAPDASDDTAVEAGSGDAGSSNAKPDKAKSSDAKSGEAKSSDAKSGEAKSGEAKSGDAKPGEAKSGDAKPGDAGSAEAAMLAEDERHDRLTTKVMNAVIPDSVENKQAMRRKLSRYFAYGLSAAIFVLAIWVLTRTIMSTNIADLRRHVEETSDTQIATALFFTFVSFVALTGYDALALRQLKLRVPYTTTALASFTSYAISFTLGFPIFTAGTVRYWIYSGKGLSAGKVASLTVIAGITFWLGMALVLGIGFAIRGEGISHIDHLSPLFNRVIGGAIIAALLGYLIWAGAARRHATIQGFRLELPGFWLTSGQMCLGMIDLCAASAVLYTLLAPPRSVDYLTFVAVYVFGSVLGIASNSPGGLGVFEATMLKTVPTPSLVAALLLFRVIYYFLPFVLALAMLGAHESIRRWKSLREAMVGNEDDDPEGDTIG